MTTALMQRFGGWLGLWRGRATFSDGSEGLMQLKISAYFEGNVMELDARTFELETGATVSVGSGLAALGADGRVREVLYGDKLGFVDLTETPDDPDVLSLRGEARGLVMSVSFQLDGEQLVLSSLLDREQVGVSPVRTVARLSRVGHPPAWEEP